MHDDLDPEDPDDDDPLDPSQASKIPELQSAILQIIHDRGGDCPEESVPLPLGMQGVI